MRCHQGVKCAWFVLLTAIANLAQAQELVINELMASNDLAHPDAFLSSTIGWRSTTQEG